MGTRRAFLHGIGAALVAAAIPQVPVEAAGAELPPLILHPPPLTSALFTYQSLFDALQDLSSQVRALAACRPLDDADKAQLADQVEEMLDYVRSPGILVEVKAPFDDILAGKFLIWEDRVNPGRVVVEGVSYD